MRKKRIRWLNKVVEGIWKRRKVGNKMKKRNSVEKREKLVIFYPLFYMK
jgi:hypothetical protein